MQHSSFFQRIYRPEQFFAIIARINRTTDCAHHHCNLCQLSSSVRYFGPSCPPAPIQGRPNRTHHLPSYRAGGRRMRVRTAAHPLARSVGPLALGPLRSEVLGESISPSIYALGRSGYSGRRIPVQCECCVNQEFCAVSVQVHSDDSVQRPSPRLPGVGRDPFPPWAPAFAGVAGFLMRHWSA
jgi:hypothetical protein